MESSKSYFPLLSIPKRYNIAAKELETVQAKIANRGDLSVAEIGIGALFAAEAYAWFCLGEIAGRGFTVTGYKP